jgi:hypothetical protein
VRIKAFFPGEELHLASLMPGWGASRHFFYVVEVAGDRDLGETGWWWVFRDDGTSCDWHTLRQVTIAKNGMVLLFLHQLILLKLTIKGSTTDAQQACRMGLVLYLPMNIVLA